MRLHAVALGQTLSVLIALTGTFSSILVQKGVSLPAAQSVVNYVALAAVYGGLLVHRKQPLSGRWPIYAALAALDVLSNFLLVQAYAYTSLTSVTLLDCWTVPCVLLLSWLFLNARYAPGHWLGSAACVGGLAVLILTDRAFSSPAGDPNPLLGDLLVVVGASGYAACNVMQEKLLGDVGRVELLGMVGLFGALWGGLLAAALEGSAIVATKWSPQVALAFLGFNGALFAFSSLVPYVLIWGGAALLNISLLSSDLWAALARIVLFGGFTPAAALSFVLAFLLVSAGIVAFSLAGDVYQTLPQGQGVAVDSDGTEVPGDGVSAGVREQDVESQRLLASALATRGRTPVGLGLGEVDSLQHERVDRKPKLADVELEYRDV